MIVLAGLLVHVFKVYAALVYAYGCACLHTHGTYAVTGDAFGEVEHCWFGATSARNLVASYVHQTVEKSPCSNYNTAGVQFNAPYGAYTFGMSVLDK